MTKQDLFIGLFPGCIVAANKAVTKNGDYQTIAYISYTGHITYFVERDRLPADVVRELETIAETERRKKAEQLERELMTEYGYYRILSSVADQLPYNKMRAMFDNLNRCETIKARRALIRGYALSF